MLGERAAVLAEVMEAARCLTPAELGEWLVGEIRAERLAENGAPPLMLGCMVLDPVRRVISAHGFEAPLSPRECCLLGILLGHAGQRFSQERLLDMLRRRPTGWPPPESRKIVDVYICKLRRKLASIGLASVIGTVWGDGYLIPDHPPPWTHPAPAEVAA